MSRVMLMIGVVLCDDFATFACMKRINMDMFISICIRTRERTLTHIHIHTIFYHLSHMLTGCTNAYVQNQMHLHTFEYHIRIPAHEHDINSHRLITH